MRMRLAGSNLLSSGKAEYVSPVVFRIYRAGQTHVSPVPVFVPRVPITGAITYTGTPIRVSQYLISSNQECETLSYSCWN